MTRDREALVALATQMQNHEVSLIEGCREIALQMRFKIGDPDNPVFLPVRAIESESDHFPLGTARANCADDYLRRMDAELEQFINDVRADVLAAFHDIVKLYSEPAA